MNEDLIKSVALQEMAKTEGWKIVEEYLQRKIEDHKDQLVTCDMDKFEEVRGSVKALKGVFVYINTTIAKGIEEE